MDPRSKLLLATGFILTLGLLPPGEFLLYFFLFILTESAPVHYYLLRMKPEIPKPRYEPPEVVELGDLAAGHGGCQTGTGDASGTCTNGGTNAGNQCTHGNQNRGGGCTNGNSNQGSGCNLGSFHSP